MIFLFFLSLIQAQEFDTIFDLNQTQAYLQKQVEINRVNVSFAKPYYEDSIKNKIINDKENLISNEFHISHYFKKKTLFWMDVYSRYTSEQTIIHDKEDLGLIYFSLDFTKLDEKDLIYRSKIQNQIASEYISRLKKTLMKFAQNQEAESDFEKMIWKAIEENKEIPSESKDSFFKELALNTRIQTGQRDSINNSISKSLPYIKFIRHYMNFFELPKELIAMPILESDFNPDSVSKTGATGLWQIMASTAQQLMPYKNNYIDARLNPYISTIAAFHLLKQNYSILNSWDLAITAYHSGTSHLLRAKRELKGKYPLNLENIFKHYNSDHHGFASENYYAEFLALAHLFEFREQIYGIKFNENEKKAKPTLYVTKCPIRPNKFFENYGQGLKKLNPHLLKKNALYKKGLLIVSDINLPETKYFKPTHEQIRRNFPMNLEKFVKNEKCL